MSINGNKLTVSPGQVASIVPSIGGVSLGNDPPPELTLTGDTGLWFCGEFDVNTTSQNINGTTYYFPLNSGSYSNFEFVLSTNQPTTIDGGVDMETGAVTTAKFAQLWADIYDNGDGTFTKVADICGNYSIAYCDNSFTFIPL
ncbi:MAG: hypothetical protein HRU13_12995 [Phycisphaerales bacterium]|nr:hypothetical protein [Phycisphaerales bacterium]